MKLDNLFRRRCHLKVFLSRALVALLFDGPELNYLCNFGRRHYEEQFCYQNYLDQWFRGCPLKIFLF